MSSWWRDVSIFKECTDLNQLTVSSLVITITFPFISMKMYHAFNIHLWTKKEINCSYHQECSSFIMFCLIIQIACMAFPGILLTFCYAFSYILEIAFTRYVHMKCVASLNLIYTFKTLQIQFFYHTSLEYPSKLEFNYLAQIGLQFDTILTEWTNIKKDRKRNT